MNIHPEVLKCWQEYQKATEPYLKIYRENGSPTGMLLNSRSGDDFDLFRDAIRPHLKVWMDKVAESLAREKGGKVAELRTKKTLEMNP